MSNITIDVIVIKLRMSCLKDLANKAGLSYGCLWAIRENKTKWPRRTTLDKLLPVIGVRLKLESID